MTFTYVPLGPWTADDGNDYCCGLHCGRPCPYGLTLKPPAEHQGMPVSPPPGCAGPRPESPAADPT